MGFFEYILWASLFYSCLFFFFFFFPHIPLYMHNLMPLLPTILLYIVFLFPLTLEIPREPAKHGGTRGSPMDRGM